MSLIFVLLTQIVKSLIFFIKQIANFSDNFYDRERPENHETNFKVPWMKRSQSSFYLNQPFQLPVPYYYPYPFHYSHPNLSQSQSLKISHLENGKRRRRKKSQNASSTLSLPNQQLSTNQENSKPISNCIDRWLDEQLKSVNVFEALF